MADNSLKVMVLEDERPLMEFMQQYIAFKFGFAVCGEVDGERAVKLYKTERPDISIIDIQLLDSKIDGIEVLAEIKKINPDAKCIMLTRITDELTIERAKALGATGYLLKPLDAKIWLDAVSKIAKSLRPEMPEPVKG